MHILPLRVLLQVRLLPVQGVRPSQMLSADSEGSRLGREPEIEIESQVGANLPNWASGEDLHQPRPSGFVVQYSMVIRRPSSSVCRG